MKRFKYLFIPCVTALVFILSGCSSGGYWGVSGDVPGTGASYYMGDGYVGHHHHSKKHYKKMRKEMKKREKERRKAYKKAQKRAKKYYKKHHRHHDD